MKVELELNTPSHYAAFASFLSQLNGVTPPVTTAATPPAPPPTQPQTAWVESAPAPEVAPAPAKEAKRGRPAKAAAQISTGQARVGPEDTAEVQEQDKADEQAEVAGQPLTIDDLRAAMGAYVDTFGMEAAQADGRAIFLAGLGKPPEGNDFWKMSLAAEQGPAVLAKACDAWRKAASAGKRFGG